MLVSTTQTEVATMSPYGMLLNRSFYCSSRSTTLCIEASNQLQISIIYHVWQELIIPQHCAIQHRMQVVNMQLLSRCRQCSEVVNEYVGSGRREKILRTSAMHYHIVLPVLVVIDFTIE